MGILVSDLRELVVKPVIERLALVNPAMQSHAAEDLLLGTAAQESQLGRYLRQHPQGPARGIYQMEQATFSDTMDWLMMRGREPLLKATLCWSSPEVPLGAQIAGNLYFATALARLKYWRAPFTLPSDDQPYDLRNLAHAWKTYWNTTAVAGTESQFIANFSRYVQQP